MATLQERFDRSVDRSHPSGCWMWTASIGSTGYGRISFKNRWIKAHRVSYELHNGAIPDGLCVCHKCDTPLCVNPSHLFVGTNKDNQQDMAAKGRGAGGRHGEQHGMAKLTDDLVREIRAAVGTQKEIAKRFGIAASNVSFIKTRRRWAHVAEVM